MITSRHNASRHAGLIFIGPHRFPLALLFHNHPLPSHLHSWLPSTNPLTLPGLPYTSFNPSCRFLFLRLFLPYLSPLPFTLSTFPSLSSLLSRAALSIWWALRTSPCRGPNPSVDRRVRWMRRAPGWQGAPDGQPGALRTSVSCLPVNAALLLSLSFIEDVDDDVIRDCSREYRGLQSDEAYCL